MVHGRTDHLSGIFFIRKLENVHNCGASVLKLRHSRATSSLVGKLVVDEIRSQPLKRPVDVVADLKRLYGVSITYNRAWMGVEKAKADTFGDYSTSFDDLRWWVDAARISNPESVFDIEYHVDTNRFSRLFVAFHACISGFNHCRPILFVDGTFLKARHKGCLLAASGKDGNQGLFPLCFAIVDSESKDNWYWFLGKLRTMLSTDRDVVFISDRNEGILDGVVKNFPLSPHAYCLFHLKQNLRHCLPGMKAGFKEYLVHLFSLAAYAPTKKAFYEIIAKLKSYGIGRVGDFLSNLPNEHWAHVFFPGKRYGEMWSNVAECFNSWIKEERHLPITQLVDRIRVKIMEQMSSRLEAAGKWNYVVCPNMNAELNRSFQECKPWTVRRSAVNVFEVQCDPSVSVNIARRTCSCCQWQFKGFPCCHAVCAIYHSQKELNSFIDPYFYVTTYRDAYSNSIYPIPTLWKPAPGGKEDSILPPLSKKPPGRPRKKRIRSNGEKTRPIKCSRCGKIGRHNKKSCKEDLRTAGT